ncbi:TcaA 3rd/4th domain-containing protein [Lactobacillus kefiranofaciens]|uniref:TcaA 3rd/4th domain-containing protein n=1 Tax=Lactobacillus kefiranofaciens TaxID=267818 RepID=UPI0021C421B6|nr:hypothetical protein [Lactobacillus kefiranofaciens]MCP9331164.1 hypothetical protein [Lactobacillus kefiranofaciens]
MKKHKKIWTFGIIILLIAAFTGLGSLYYTKDRQIERIVANLQNPKAEMAKYVIPSTPDMNVTDSSLKPLQSYFKEHKKAARRLAYNLRHNRDSAEIQLVESGRYFIIFPKYRLRVQCYRPQVQTNHADSTLYVDRKNYGQMQGGDQNYYQDLGLVFPGRYHVLVKAKVNGRQLDADSIVNIWSNKTVNMKIKTATFQIRSVPNGIIYVNDRKVGKLTKNGTYTFKDYPIAKRMEIYIKSKSDGQTIKSEKVTDLSQSITAAFSDSEDDVTDYDSTQDYQGNNQKDVYQDAEGDYIVNPIWPGLIQVGDATRILYENFKQPSEDDFENGKDNSDYQKLTKRFKSWKKDKKLKKVNVEIKVLSVMPGRRNYSKVDYEVTLIKKFKNKGKKKEKLLYQNAIFHYVEQQQRIQTIGESKSIKTKK